MAIPVDIERQLLARSGGYCANPICRADLFPEVAGGKIATVKELAHIIAQSADGPRGDDALPQSERDAYANIVLLCPTCHELVDKMKLCETYDADLLREWKRDQEQRIKDAIEVPHLGSADELRKRIWSLMRENRTWWAQYGPESPSADDHPLSEASDVWLAGARRVVIPNNWQIIRLAERNSEYLSEDELAVISTFKLHAEAFASRHLGGDINPYAPRFPQEMDTIFEPGGIHG